MCDCNELFDDMDAKLQGPVANDGVDFNWDNNNTVES